MKVRLIGTNVELEPLSDVVTEDTDALLSPEPIAAAYARISRSPKTVSELRVEARTNVDKARRSNRTIVFDMGHASIAEHAVFNFDLEGISRLAIEEVERARLASYTERSQRYVLIGEDYVVPEAVVEAGLERLYREAVGGLFAGYQELYEGLLTAHRQRSGPDLSRPELRDLEVSAKEDARYLLPLATTGQLGMTLNARSLEGMARRLKGSKLAEVREVGDRLVKEALRVTPSLVRYTEPTGPEALLEAPLMAQWDLPSDAGSGQVRLLHVTSDAERLLAGAEAALNGRGRLESSEVAWGNRFHDAKSLARRYYEQGDQHTRAPRLFELVDFVFEVTCSAACFGQLKRHRMATMLAQPYHRGLGITVPPTVREAGLEARMGELVRDAERAQDVIAQRVGPSAAYLLTNAHCRTVILKINLRELYHFARLRMDAHAQWEIRNLATSMVTLARREVPESGAYLAGKDRFGELLSP